MSFVLFTHQTVLALSATLTQLPLQAGLEGDLLLLLSDLSWMEKDKKVQQPVHHLVDLLAVARLSSHLSLGPSHGGWQMRIALHNRITFTIKKQDTRVSNILWKQGNQKLPLSQSITRKFSSPP